MLLSLKKLTGFLIIATMVLLACKPSQILPTDYVALRTGTSLQTLAGLTLKADSVSVSICPDNVNCLIANNAHLTLNLSKGTQSTSVRLFSWIPDYGLRRPVSLANLTDSTSVEFGGQRYKVILRGGRYTSDSGSVPKSEVIVQVSPL